MTISIESALFLMLMSSIISLVAYSLYSEHKKRYQRRMSRYLIQAMPRPTRFQGPKLTIVKDKDDK